MQQYATICPSFTQNIGSVFRCLDIRSQNPRDVRCLSMLVALYWVRVIKNLYFIALVLIVISRIIIDDEFQTTYCSIGYYVPNRPISFGRSASTNACISNLYSVLCHQKPTSQSQGILHSRRLNVSSSRFERLVIGFNRLITQSTNGKNLEHEPVQIEPTVVRLVSFYYIATAFSYLKGGHFPHLLLRG